MMNRQLSAVFSSYETAQLAAKRVKEKFPDANAAAIAKNPDSREVSVPPTAFLDGTLGGAVIPATMTGARTAASTLLGETHMVRGADSDSISEAVVQVNADPDTCRNIVSYLSDCGGLDITVQ